MESSVSYGDSRRKTVSPDWSSGKRKSEFSFLAYAAGNPLAFLTGKHFSIMGKRAIEVRLESEETEGNRFGRLAG